MQLQPSGAVGSFRSDRRFREDFQCANLAPHHLPFRLLTRACCMANAAKNARWCPIVEFCTFFSYCSNGCATNFHSMNETSFLYVLVCNIAMKPMVNLKIACPCGFLILCATFGLGAIGCLCVQVLRRPHTNTFWSSVCRWPRQIPTFEIAFSPVANDFVNLKPGDSSGQPRGNEFWLPIGSALFAVW